MVPFQHCTIMLQIKHYRACRPQMNDIGFVGVFRLPAQQVLVLTIDLDIDAENTRQQPISVRLECLKATRE